MRLTLAAAAATVAVSTTLHPLFATGSWFWSAFGAVLAATTAAAAVGWLGRSPLFCPVAAIAALFVYVTARHAPDEAFGALLPTVSASEQLLELARQGWADIQWYAVPAPPTPGITVITDVGIGLIAVGVDFLAVRMRRAALAVFPLLTLLSVPVVVGGENLAVPSFLVAAVGVLWLLLSDGRDRLGRWGRPVPRIRLAGHTPVRSPPAREAVADMGPFASSGWRIGLTAVGLAVLVPPLLPNLQPRALTLGEQGVGGSAVSSMVTAPDPIVAVNRSLTQPQTLPVLSYRSTDPQPEYLRIYALDLFDGERWRMSRVYTSDRDRVAGQLLPPPQGLFEKVSTQPVRTELTVDRRVRRLRYLPLPYPAARITAKGDWRVDRRSAMVSSPTDNAAGLGYQVVSLRVAPTPGQLAATFPPPPDLDGKYLQVPPGDRDNLPPSVFELAQRLTGTAQTSYGKAVALQKWFTTSGNFRYSLNRPPGNSSSALAEFLLDNRTGYCEQFAAGMALLARIIGIPARVAVGYTTGTRTATNSWMVTTRDAHAWPELYFHGVGWVRFEPTPSGSDGQGTASVPPYAQPAAPGGDRAEGPGGASPAPQDTQPSEPLGSTQIDRRLREFERESPATAAGPKSGEGLSLPAKIGVGAGLLGSLGAVPPLLRMLIRRRRRWMANRPVTGAHAAWAELRDDLTDLGVSWRTSESPRTVGRQLIERYELDATASAAVNRLARAAEQACYAPGPSHQSGLARDNRLARRALARSVSWRRRVRARLMPSSAVLRLRAVPSKIAYGTEWLITRRLGGVRDEVPTSGQVPS